MAEFPIDDIRPAFPALNTGDGFVFFDNAAGAQIPDRVLAAVRDHLVARNVQRGGRYPRSVEVDEAMARARTRVATFLNAFHPDEVAFGINATSFIRIVSLAIGQTLGDRREIIVTDLDHEANIATWLALEASGAQIRWWRMRDDGRLHPEDLDPLLSARTRLVACTLASNAIGSLVDPAQVAARAHAAGAQVFLDAVHYAPHGPIDVQAFGCDYLVCSGYKIFAPHMGFLWGRRPALDALPTFREHFIPDRAPAKLEVGTYGYEAVSGMAAAIDYLEELGRQLVAQGFRHAREPWVVPAFRPASEREMTPRAAIVRAMDGVRAYEAELSTDLLAALADIRGAKVWGLRDPADVGSRTPTVCFTLDGVAPADIAKRLAGRGFGVRDGHMYAPRLMQRLGVPVETGAVRASLVHYNTREEIERFVSALDEIAHLGRAGL